MKTARQLSKCVKRSKLKRLRMTAGIRLAEVAQQVGIDPSHMSLLESGLRKPSLAVAGKLAKFYGTSIDELWGRLE